MGNLHISNPSIAFLESGKVMLAYRFNRDGEQNGFALANSFLGPFRSTANLTKAPGNDEDPVCTDAACDRWRNEGQSALTVSVVAVPVARESRRIASYSLPQWAPRVTRFFFRRSVVFSCVSIGCSHGRQNSEVYRTLFGLVDNFLGITWFKSPTGSHAFELQLELDNGKSVELARRERPEILFGSDGAPRFLYNGANTVGASLPGNELPAPENLESSHHGGFSHAFSLIQRIKG